MTDTQPTAQKHVHAISQLALIIAVIAVILLIALYALMRTQSDEVAENSAAQQVVQSQGLTVEEKKEKDAKYQQELSEALAPYITGSVSAQETVTALSRISVSGTYKSLHVKITSVFSSTLTDEERIAEIRLLDAEHSWLIE